MSVQDGSMAVPLSNVHDRMLWVVVIAVNTGDQKVLGLLLLFFAFLSTSC